jgi:hypothetical protein
MLAVREATSYDPSVPSLHTRRAFVGGIALVSAAACHSSSAGKGGDQTLPLTSFASGSRLRAHVFDGGGDAALFVAWTDAKLGEDCAFARLPDGSLRCLPPQPGPNRLVYADSGCSTPAAIVGTPSCGKASSSFVYDSTSSAPAGCESVPSVKDGLPGSFLPYVLGSALPGGPLAYFTRDPDGNCLPGTGSAPLVSVAQADPATFVAATTADATRGARLGVRVLTADDGAEQVTAIVDDQAGAVCTPISRWLGGNDTHCVPTEIAWASSTFVDAACSQRTAYVGTHCATPTVVVDESSSSACQQALRFFEVGAPAVGGEYSLGASGACSPAYEPPFFRFVHVGAPIDPAAYEATTTGSIGSGRLTSGVLASADGVPLAGVDVEMDLLSFFDTQLGVFCAPTWVGGKLLCVPTTASGDSFADAACTVPVVGWTAAGAACFAPPPSTVLVTGPGGCPEGDSLAELGPAYSPSALYRFDPVTQACGPVPVSTSASYYRVGAPIDPGIFAPVADTTR